MKPSSKSSSKSFICEFLTQLGIHSESFRSLPEGKVISESSRLNLLEKFSEKFSELEKTTSS